MLARILGERNTYSLLIGVQTGTATVEINVEVPPKARNRPSRFSYTTLGHIPKGLSISLQRYMLIHVHWCSIHNSQELKQPRCLSTNEWIMKKLHM